ncbi:MAG: hypothetical protein C4294_05605 [Nitrospiraceae bacterium]
MSHPWQENERPIEINREPEPADQEAEPRRRRSKKAVGKSLRRTTATQSGTNEKRGEGSGRRSTHIERGF